MTASSKDVMYQLLYEAIQTIRTVSAGHGPLDEERRQYIWSVAYLVHNWPAGLRAASTEEEFDRFLAASWAACPPDARDWLERRLSYLGVDPDDLARRD